MAKSNGKVDTEKIIAILEKSDINEVVVAYYEIKSYVTELLIKHTNDLEEQQNKFQLTKDNL